MTLQLDGTYSARIPTRLNAPTTAITTMALESAVAIAPDLYEPEGLAVFVAPAVIATLNR